MIGIVVVSHSRQIAEGICELARQIWKEAGKILPAGGLPDGSLGTDTMEILAQLKAADAGHGVLVLADLGSSILSTQAAVALLDGAFPVEIADAPVLEGTVSAVIAAAQSDDLQEVKRAAEEARELHKP